MSAGADKKKPNAKLEKNDRMSEQTGKLKNGSKQQGQSLLELALVLPFLLIVVMSVLELGMINLTAITLRDAVQEAASYASVCPTDNAAVRNRLRQSSTFPGDLSGVSDGDITICVINAGSSTCGGNGIIGSSVRVSLDYDYSVMTPLLAAMVGGTQMNLPASVERIIISTACP